MSANSAVRDQQVAVCISVTSLCQFSCIILIIGLLLVSATAMAQETTLKAKLNTAQKLWISQHPEVEYALEADYGPFIYLDQQGEVKGLSVDVLKLISSKTGLRFKPGPPSHLAAILAQAQMQKLALITSLRATPERSGFLNFSSPYAAIPAVLVLAERQPLKTLSELKGRRIAVGKAYAVEQFVRSTYPEIEWQSVPDDLSALKALQLGEVEGVVADLASLNFLRSHPDSPKFAVAAKVGFTYELSFAFSKDQTELAAIVQAGLLAISPTERDNLLNKWMPAEADINPQDYRLISVILLSLLLASWFAFRHFRRRCALPS